jgi:hypothetical protein
MPTAAFSTTPANIDPIREKRGKVGVAMVGAWTGMGLICVTSLNNWLKPDYN